MSDIQLKMTSTIKALVSRKKIRYKEDGFNLDLTYIYDNVIAMGYPAAKLEGVYRNHINDVFKFLETKHKDHYKIYNLCSERSYDVRRFHDRVSVFPFEDHNPPKLELIKPFCHDVDAWLSQDPQNVAVVHCKAGKGRTGLMICCYILHRGWSETADEALRHYGQTRTHDKKGVTIPSQRRYVDYYDQLLKSGVEYSLRPLLLHEVRIEPVPNLSGGCVPVMTIFEAESQVQISPTVELTKANGVLRMTLNPPMTLKGDVRLTLKNKPNVMMLKEKMFHFWFNTFFVKEKVRLPPCTPSHTSHKSPEAAPQSTNGSDGTHSLTKAAGLALGRLSVGPGRLAADRNDRANLGANPILQPGSRASSLNLEECMDLNSTHTDKPSSTNSASSEWLTLTLTKRELDRACKDSHHRIFTADFKVTLYFTPAGHYNAGSLPNMAESPSSNMATGAGAPSMFNHVMSAPTLLPTANSLSTNGSARKDLPTNTHRRPTQQQSNRVTGTKPSSPQNLGLLGPICWRIPPPCGDQTDGSSTRKFRFESDEEDGIRQILDPQCATCRHSDSSQWSSEENDSSDVESLGRNGISATGACVCPPPTAGQDDDDDDEQEDDDAHFCSSSVTVGRYRLLSYSACNSSAGFHAMCHPRQSLCQQQGPQEQPQLQQPPSTAQSPK